MNDSTSIDLTRTWESVILGADTIGEAIKALANDEHDERECRSSALDQVDRAQASIAEASTRLKSIQRRLADSLQTNPANQP